MVSISFIFSDFSMFLLFISKHPMCDLSVEMLRTIPDTWLDNFNVCRRFENVDGFIQKKSQNSQKFIELKILGDAYKIDAIQQSDNEHNFICKYKHCESRLRLFGESKIISSAITKKSFVKFNVELLALHTCSFNTRQEFTITYLDILRKHILKENGNRLNSFTGFYLYRKGGGNKSMINAPMAIFDHIFLPDALEQEYNFCRNDLKLRCYYKNSKCGVQVLVYTRNMYTCRVLSRCASHSKNISNSHLFECVNDEIGTLNEPCKNPIYLIQNKHVLSNGLKYIIPELDAYVLALKWTQKYEEYDAICSEEFEKERANRPQSSSFESSSDDESNDEEEDTLMLEEIQKEQANRPHPSFFESSSDDDKMQ